MIQRTLLIVLLVPYPLGVVWADDWPQWQGPDRTGISKEKGLLKTWPEGGPKLLWTYREAGQGHSCPSIVGKRLYCLGAEGDKEYVYVIDLKTRKKLWSTEIGDTLQAGWGHGPRSTPTVDGKFLYVLSGQADLVCVETATGKKVWSQGLKTDLNGAEPSFNYSESPLVDGDLVIATPGGDDGAIAAFDKMTGKLKWRTTDLTNRAGNSSAIVVKIGGVRQYIQRLQAGNASTGIVVGVRASDGEVLWKHNGNGYVATPIYRNRCVYVNNEGGSRLVKITGKKDQFDAKTVYATHDINNEHCNAVLIGDYLYGYSEEGRSDDAVWVCQEFKTGKTMWRKNPLEDGMDRGCAIFADGNLYAYHEKKGDVLLFEPNPKEYVERGRFRIPEESQLPRNGGEIWTLPVIANGKLYLRDQELIFCYDIRQPK